VGADQGPDRAQNVGGVFNLQDRDARDVSRLYQRLSIAVSRGHAPSPIDSISSLQSGMAFCVTEIFLQHVLVQ